MKRLIVEGEWFRTIDDDGWALPLGAGTQGFLCVPDRLVSSVEDIADPLPTEPGAMFWGKTNGSDAQRWFVQRLFIGDAATAIVYCPADKTLGAEDINGAHVERSGLVRLPDPEVAP